MGTYSITPTVAQAMIGGTSTYAESLGASPVIRFYSGTVPTNANTALSGNITLATLTAAATPIASTSDTGTAGRATWAAIANATAAATGTVSFFRTLKADLTTVIDQGTVGTSAADAIVNTTAWTSGSTISITSRTNDLPYGP
jgi:hypothetical protein